MYVPAHAREERVEILRAAVEQIRFGTLATVRDGRPVLTHCPMAVVEGRDGDTIVGHLARANDQWRGADGSAALAAFVGPQFYVSPSAYAAKAEHGRVVPTWDYLAVEAAGTLALVEDPGALHEIVALLTDRLERGRPQPWAVDDAPESFVAGQLRGIVGFRLAVEAWTGAWKLSLNRDDADRAGVAAGAEADPRPEVRALGATIRAGRDQARDGSALRSSA